MGLRAAIVVLICLLTITVLTLADSPPANTIPIIGLKSNYDDIDTEFFCLLSWHYFDGLSQQFELPDSILVNVVLPADTVGMLTVVNPGNANHLIKLYSHMFAMDEDFAYARPGWDGYVIDSVTTCSSDTLLDKVSAAGMRIRMENMAEGFEELFNDSSHSVWFYYGYDEAPANQWSHMMNDEGVVHYDSYIPSLFTLEMDSAPRPELGLTDSLWQPTFGKVDSLGVLSWLAWHIHHEDPTREMSYITSCLHTIALNEWADYTNIPENPDLPYPGTPAVQANSIRAIFSTKYQAYDTTDAVDNYPSFIALDAYPFRLVGTSYQATEPYTPQLGTSLENWMINHYEQCMDSTFIPAWQIRNYSFNSKDVSVFFVPQAFGRAGGTAMWSGDSLQYGSYAYRIPTPQEFRMHCNSALIRGAKAILPYCLTSYLAGENANVLDAGLLDENNIPFDAPYEEWVYRDRPTDSLSYISPDSIAPFIDGFDPQNDLPDRPDTVSGSQRTTENFLLWKFSAYGRLWTSTRGTFADIARVAPELALLNWWEDHEDLADIDYDGICPDPFQGAQIKVFTDSLEASCYLYYLNRDCIANNSPFEITVDAGDFPEATPFTEYALDHNRRFITEGELSGQDTYSFLDTLDAGEARLLQMFDDEDPLAADIRITDPDLFVVLPYDSDTLSDYQSCPGTPVAIHATFYNMGMDSLSNIFVYLKDETNNVMLDTARVSFEGLSITSCYEQDRDEAVFVWTPDSTTDIGVHRLRVFTQDLNEPDTTDNDAELVYVVEPRDYATEILDDPWNMTEATSTPFPIWNTNDITSMTGWNINLFTDSISGMFEGGIDDPTELNRMFLNTGSDSLDWIDADSSVNFSLAGKSTVSMDIELHWVDSHDDSSHIDTGENLTSAWREIGPIDLSAILGSTWGGDDVAELWIEFYSPTHSSATDVRIGWIKLTE